MNYQLKLKLVALVATFSGTFATCQAQVESQPPIGSGVVQPAEQQLGAFGAIRAAVPETEQGRGYELPPIVSSERVAMPMAQNPYANVPPIVRPDQANSTRPSQMDAPIPRPMNMPRPMSQDSYGNVPPIVTPDQANATQPSQMNKPLARPFDNTPLPASMSQDSYANVPPIVTPDQMKNAPLEQQIPRAQPNRDYERQTPEFLYQQEQHYVDGRQPTNKMAPPAHEVPALEDTALEMPSLKSPMEIADQMVAIDHAPPMQDKTVQDQPMFASSTVDTESGMVAHATTGSLEEESSVEQAAQWGTGVPVNGVSSSGVPIYSQPSAALPPIIKAGSSTTVPIVQGSSSRSPIQGSSSRSPIQGSGTRTPPIVSGGQSLAPPTPIYSAPPANSIVPQPTFAQPQGLTIDPSYGQTYFANPPVEAPVISSSGNALGASSCTNCDGGGCNDCGIANSGLSVSNCQNCGDNGCCNQETLTSRFNSCGSISGARRYLIADALYFTLDDSSLINSNFGGLGDYDFEAGWRFTLGGRSDSTQGREITYMGLDTLEESATRTDPLGRISALFTGANGFTDSETSAFQNAVQQTESRETDFHSIEYNRVRWGWDVVKTFVGLRYFYLDDEYELLSNNAFGETGSFELSTNNNLIGPHIGGELFYDVGYRWSLSGYGKAGVYANFNEVDTSLINNGAQFINTSDDNVTVSGSIEIGLTGHYQVSQRSRLRAGYQLLWLGDVATTPENFTPLITPTTGSSGDDSDHLLFHGLNVGFEIYR